MFNGVLVLPVSDAFFSVERLKMWSTVDVQCCTEQCMDQQEIGHITLWNQSTGKNVEEKRKLQF